MRPSTRPRWLGLRVAFASVVVALLVFELFTHRYWYVSLVQAVLVVGIIVTSVLDLRGIYHQNKH